MSGIRFIKVSAWEEQFEQRIADLRAAELKLLRKYMVCGVHVRHSTSCVSHSVIVQIVNQFSVLLWTALPLLVSLATFSAYALAGNTLTASRIFTSLALFNLLRFPMAMLPNVINNLVEATVSLKRIQVFLTAAEVCAVSCLMLWHAQPTGLTSLRRRFAADGCVKCAPPRQRAGEHR